MKTVTFDETQWKLVPTVPSEQMVTNGANEVEGPFDWPSSQAQAHNVYEAMLAAAPQPDHGESDA